MSRGRQLVSRIQSRLFGQNPGPAPLGQGWSDVVAAAWPDLTELVDGQLKRPGTAAVSTWEVCAANLARVVIGEADERSTIERFSDALVPTLDALQGPHKGLPTALAEGRKNGEAAGTLAAATRPLVLLPHGLDAALAAGWSKTLAFLEPVIAGAHRPDAAREALIAVGPKLAAGAQAAEATLRERLSKLPQATDAVEGIEGPFLAWAEVLDRAIEVEIYTGAQAMIASLRP